MKFTQLSIFDFIVIKFTLIIEADTILRHQIIYIIYSTLFHQMQLMDSLDKYIFNKSVCVTLIVNKKIVITLAINFDLLIEHK